jgi:hypothetical protein
VSPSSSEDNSYDGELDDLIDFVSMGDFGAEDEAGRRNLASVFCEMNSRARDPTPALKGGYAQYHEVCDEGDEISTLLTKEEIEAALPPGIYLEKIGRVPRAHALARPRARRQQKIEDWDTESLEKLFASVAVDTSNSPPATYTQSNAEPPPDQTAARVVWRARRLCYSTSEISKRASTPANELEALKGVFDKSDRSRDWIWPTAEMPELLHCEACKSDFKAKDREKLMQHLIGRPTAGNAQDPLWQSKHQKNLETAKEGRKAPSMLDYLVAPKSSASVRDANSAASASSGSALI